MNIDDIENLSLWIENWCLGGHFKPLSIFESNLTNFSENGFFQFFWIFGYSMIFSFTVLRAQNEQIWFFLIPETLAIFVLWPFNGVSNYSSNMILLDKLFLWFNAFWPTSLAVGGLKYIFLPPPVWKVSFSGDFSWSETPRYRFRLQKGVKNKFKLESGRSLTSFWCLYVLHVPSSHCE